MIEGVGLADAITPYNEAAEQVTAGIYAAFTMGDLIVPAFGSPSGTARDLFLGAGYTRCRGANG